jgi:hypothetical protein
MPGRVYCGTVCSESVPKSLPNPMSDEPKTSNSQQDLPDWLAKRLVVGLVVAAAICLITSIGLAIANKVAAGTLTAGLFVGWCGIRNCNAAVQAGNDVFNPRVERALAERAIGYWIDEEEEIIINGKVARLIRRKKFIPPDVTAGIYWTKNRMKDKWSDVHKHEHQPKFKSSAELIEDLRKQILDLQAEGYLQGVKVYRSPEE